MDPNNLVSFSGIFLIMAIAWLFSRQRRTINWRVIGWGLILQFILAAFIFVVPAGAGIFLALNELAVTVLNASTAGSRFVFGPLAAPPGAEGSLGFILAFQGLPTILFFSALISILYYLNILPRLIRLFSSIFTKLMRISGAESLCAASNIFVGVESTITVKPHLAEMTDSELCTVLTAGMATVASNVLALYVFTLQDLFPSIAAHLISASFLSAPAAVIMAKIIYPETGSPTTLNKEALPYYEKDHNLFEAVINGANSGVRVIVGITALLIAVLGLVELLDITLAFLGNKINILLDTSQDWSLKSLLGYLFYPLTLIIGIPVADAPEVAGILGERLIITEVAAYRDLASLMARDGLQHDRSAVITAYGLCGFAHIASMAIFTGGAAALAPARKSAIAKIAPRALLAATFACLLTACIAGTFYMEDSLLFTPR